MAETYTTDQIGEMLSNLIDDIEQIKTGSGDYEPNIPALYQETQTISTALRSLTESGDLSATESRDAHKLVVRQLYVLDELVDGAYTDLSENVTSAKDIATSAVNNTTQMLEILSEGSTKIEDLCSNVSDSKQEILQYAEKQAGVILTAMTGKGGLSDNLKAYIDTKSTEALEKYGENIDAAKEEVLTEILYSINTAKEELSSQITSGNGGVVTKIEEIIDQHTTQDKSVIQIVKGHGRDTQHAERMVASFVAALSGEDRSPTNPDTKNMNVSGVNVAFPDDPASKRFAYVTAAYGKNTLGAVMAADEKPNITEADEAMNLFNKASELGIGDNKADRVFDHILPENAQDSTTGADEDQS